MNRKLTISQSFSRQVISYHNSACLQQEIASKLASFLPSLESASILEIGCGTGFLTKHLISNFPNSQLFISDLSPHMVAFTQKNNTNHTNIIFSPLDGENLPIEYIGKFDLIISSMALQWFITPFASLKKLQSYLKPNGKILYSTLGPDNFPEWRQALNDLSLDSGLIKSTILPGVFLHENIKVPHLDGLSFLKSLKEQGTQTPNVSYRSLKAGTLIKVLKYLDKQGRYHTWHITYGSLPLTNL